MKKFFAVSVLFVVACASKTFSATFIGPIPYLCQSDSPFKDTIAADTTFLETFEGGKLNVPGVTASAGQVIGPEGPFPGLNDSVDCDDGVIDGRGTGGHDWFVQDANFVTFTFNADALGGRLPTHAGIVWTDGAPGTKTIFEAFGTNGVSLGTIGPTNIADNEITGTTGEDRFFGLREPSGISAIKISNSDPGIEVDHLQYGNETPIAPPAPPLLTITRTGDPQSQFLLSWPKAGSQGFILEGAATLKAPVKWVDVGISPTVTNGQNTVRGNWGVPMQFYRVRKPEPCRRQGIR